MDYCPIAGSIACPATPSRVGVIARAILIDHGILIDQEAWSYKPGIHHVNGPCPIDMRRRGTAARDGKGDHNQCTQQIPVGTHDRSHIVHLYFLCL
jgi:hypothetical protein